MTKFTWPVRIYYEDTDAGGVVYYANYLKYMERARSEWLRDLGFDQHRLRAENGILFAVRSVKIDYLAPARLDDELLVDAELPAPGRARLAFRHEIRTRADSRVLVRGEVVVVCIDAHRFRPTGLPAVILEKLTSEQ